MVEICVWGFMITIVAIAIIAIASSVWFMMKCNELINEKKKNSNSWVDKGEES